MDINSIDGTQCRLGESPVWLEATQELAWVDIDAGNLHAVSPFASGSEVRTISLNGPVGCIAPTQAKSLLAGIGSDLFMIDNDSPAQHITAVDGQGVRFNDGKCDPFGTFIVGTTDLTFTSPIAHLYALKGRQLVTLLDGVTISNGLDWPDSSSMYYIDSPTRRIDMFDYDTEGPKLRNRRTVVSFEDAWGLPDGMTVDVDGNLWVACYSGSAVRAFSPTGELLETIELPVDEVTSCTFGGPNLDHLFVTTASTNMSEDPRAGCVFIAETTSRGRPAFRWMGSDHGLSWDS